MVRKPTLSPSKITTYLACPVKYKWTYVDPKGKWFLKSKSYYSFGTSLHNVLQRFHDSEDFGVQTKEQTLASLEESWISAGYSTPEEASEALAEGRELVSRYVDAHYSAPISANTLYVEKQLRKDFGPFVLVGRIDRLDEHEDGTLEIVDYKSGRDHTDPEEVMNDISMNCYQLLVRSIFPNRRVLSTVIALRTGDKTTIEPNEISLIEFEQDLLIIGKEILSRDYENILPIAKDLCCHCDFITLCRKHDEFAENIGQFLNDSKAH
jgi:putative RecB family exonuclease